MHNACADTAQSWASRIKDLTLKASIPLRTIIFIISPAFEKRNVFYAVLSPYEESGGTAIFRYFHLHAPPSSLCRDTLSSQLRSSSSPVSKSIASEGLLSWNHEPKLHNWSHELYNAQLAVLGAQCNCSAEVCCFPAWQLLLLFPREICRTTQQKELKQTQEQWKTHHLWWTRRE